MTEPRAENVTYTVKPRHWHGVPKRYAARISYVVNGQRKQYRKSFPHTKQGKKDADFWAQQEKAKLKQNSNRNLTIKDLMDRNLSRLKREERSAGHLNEQARYYRKMKPLHKLDPRERSTRDAIEQWLYSNTTSESVRNSQKKSLNTVFNNAKQEDIIESNLIERIRINRPKRKEMKIIPFELKDSFFSAIRGKEKMERSSYELYFATLLWTACRPSEITALTWDDIDYTNKAIRITKKLSRHSGSEANGWVLKDYTKTREDRSIPIWTELEALFGTSKEDSPIYQAQDERLKRRIRRSGFPDPLPYGDLVFRSTRNQTPVDALAATRNLKPYLDYLDIDHFGMGVYAFRHTAATWMVESGLDTAFVQEIMGHANIAQTMRYVHVSKKSLLQNMNEIYGSYVSSNR